MGLIDWDSATRPAPPSPLSGELANIHGMLSAFAERRLKQQQLDQQAAQAAAAQAEETRHHKELEGYNTGVLSNQRDVATAKIKAKEDERRQKATDERQKRGEEVLPKIQSLIDAGDIAGAEALARAHQMDWGGPRTQGEFQRQGPQPVAPFAEEPPALPHGVTKEQNAMQPPSQAEIDYNERRNNADIDEAFNYIGPQAEYDQQKAAHDRGRNQYRVRMPAGTEIMLDANAAAEARLSRGQALAQRLSPRIEAFISKLPEEEKDLARSAAQAGVGHGEGGAGTDEQAFESFVKQFNENRAQANANARSLNRPRGPSYGIDKKKDDERLDRQQLEQKIDRWEKSRELRASYGSFKSFRKNVELIKSKNPIANIGVMYGIAKYITGPGILQNVEYQNVMGQIAPLVDEIQDRIKRKTLGEMDQDKLEIVKNASIELAEQQQHEVADTLANFDDEFADPHWDAVGLRNYIQNQKKSYMKLFGLTDAQKRARAAGGSTAPAASPTPAHDAELNGWGF